MSKAKWYWITCINDVSQFIEISLLRPTNNCSVETDDGKMPDDNEEDETYWRVIIDPHGSINKLVRSFGHVKFRIYHSGEGDGKYHDVTKIIKPGKWVNFSEADINPPKNKADSPKTTT